MEKEGLTAKLKGLKDEVIVLKNNKDQANNERLTILEKTIPVIEKEKEDLRNEVRNREELSEKSKALARLLMDENLELRKHLEAVLRPDMAVPTAQEQSKKALLEMKESYKNMFSNLIEKVTQIQKEGEKLPVVEEENLSLRKELAGLINQRATLFNDNTKANRVA